MIPKHSNPKNYRSHAPYNFIPLPEKLVTVDENIDQDVYMINKDGHTIHTGYIECKMTTESPLYIRCPMSTSFFKDHGDKRFHELETNQKNERAQFFHLENQNCPVIPGSSLRGMVRTLVEIAGYGKMQWISDDTKVTYRAVASGKRDPLYEPYNNILGKYGINVKAGYLIKRRNDWFVLPAKKPADLGLPENIEYLKVKEKDIPENAIEDFKNFNDPKYKPQYHEIGFNAEIRKSSNMREYTYISRLGLPGDSYEYKGVLISSGNMLETGSKNPSPRKNRIIILEKNEDAIELKINEQSIKNYILGLTPFQKESPFNSELGCLVEGRPIFYIEDNENEVTFIGHCPNFRVPAIIPEKKEISSPVDFVPEDVKLKKETDISEAIFGYTHERKNDSMAGRVFFTDARVEFAEEGIWFKDDYITPKILSSPKPTCFQHYLVQDSSKGHSPDKTSELAHYTTSLNETVIRGHKMYWHRGEVSLEDIIESDTKKINNSMKSYTGIRPINTGVTFSFRIYFENLRDFELGALLWVLELPGKEGTGYRHKLGMGKPYGMGTVKIEHELYEIDRDKRYHKLFDEDSWFEAVQKATEKSRIKLIEIFEKLVLTKIGENDKVKSLSDVERIKMLLKMMEWKGPDTKLTEYCQIDEFRQRRVLPDPLNIKSRS